MRSFFIMVVLPFILYLALTLNGCGHDVPVSSTVYVQQTLPPDYQLCMNDCNAVNSVCIYIANAQPTLKLPCTKCQGACEMGCKQWEYYGLTPPIPKIERRIR